MQHGHKTDAYNYVFLANNNYGNMGNGDYRGTSSSYTSSGDDF